MRRPTQRYYLTDEGKKLLHQYYDGSTQNIDLLCRLLEAPRWRVKKWAIYYHLSRQSEWTQEEDQYLEQNYSRYSIEQLMEHFRRTARTIQNRAHYLGITKTTDGMTLYSLADALGCRVERIRKWIDRGWLRASRRQTKKERDYWYISEAAIKDFLIKHPLEVDPGQFGDAWPWIVNILTDAYIGR